MIITTALMYVVEIAVAAESSDERGPNDSRTEDPIKEFCAAVNRGDYAEAEALLLSLPQTRSFAAAAKVV